MDFAGYADEEGYGEATLFITKDSPWVKEEHQPAPFGLADAATFLAFNYNEEGDSYETQFGDCQERFDAEILRALGGDMASVRHELEKALGWDLTHALDEAGVHEVRLFKDREGRWTFTLDGKAV